MSSETIVLAHLSDVHLPSARPIPLAALNLKRVLGAANWYRYRRHVHVRRVLDTIVADMQSHRPDHIAVTGDLVNLGLPHEHEAALQWLAMLGAPGDVSVVPGNHDTYVRLKGDPGHHRWQAYMSGDGNGRVEPLFPYVRRRGPMALIGLGSGVPTPPFVSAGQLGETQLQALSHHLEQTKRDNLVRVVALHHPPHRYAHEQRSGLKDAAALEALLADAGADVVLHGHFHRAQVRWIEGKGGRVPVVGVPSASAAIRHNADLAGYNLLHVTRDDGGRHRVVLVRRGLAEAGGSVVETGRVMLSGDA